MSILGSSWQPWLRGAVAFATAVAALVAWIFSVISWVGPCYDCPRVPDIRAAIVSIVVAAAFLTVTLLMLPPRASAATALWSRRIVGTYARAFAASFVASITAGVALSAVWDSVMGQPPP